MKTSKPVVALALIAVLGTGVGCARVRSKAAMKDGNKDYKEENFKKAVDDYERAVKHDPNFAEAWFYLGSSHQAQYRPGKDTPDNKKQLEDAIAAFAKSLETNPGQTDAQKNVKPATAHRSRRPSAWRTALQVSPKPSRVGRAGASRTTRRAIRNETTGKQATTAKAAPKARRSAR